MAYVHPAWLEYQRQRFTRPDGDRYLRHDAHRYLFPDADPSLLPAHLREQRPSDGKYKTAKPPLLAEERAAELRDEQTRLEAIRIIRDAQRELATLKHELALRRKAYNPNQPRVPRGNPDGGQWTRIAAAGPFLPRISIRFGRDFPGTTSGQLHRLGQAIARTERALEGIRQYEPNWRPSTQSFMLREGMEGAIRHAEARAAQSEARFEQLRSGIGGNFGPPLNRRRLDLAPVFLDCAPLTVLLGLMHIERQTACLICLASRVGRLIRALLRSRRLMASCTLVSIPAPRAIAKMLMATPRSDCVPFCWTSIPI